MSTKPLRGPPGSVDSWCGQAGAQVVSGTHLASIRHAPIAGLVLCADSEYKSLNCPPGGAMHIALNAPTAEQLVFMQSAASAATRMPQAATGPPCASCRHRQLCLPGDMPASDLQRLEGLMLGQRRIREGQTAF